MRSTIGRAGAFAAIAALSLGAPALGIAAALPFVVVAVAAMVITSGPLFELFARPLDRQEGQLRGLFGFALTAALLAVFATSGGTSLPVGVFAGTLLLVAVGNLAATAAEELDVPWRPLGWYAVGGAVGGLLGQVGTALVAGAALPDAALLAFVTATAVLLATLLRSVLWSRDEPPILLSVALLSWLLVAVGTEIGVLGVGVALGITVGFGYLSYALETASVEGMLTGMLLSLLVLVLGGAGWFAMLIAFFAIGGLSTKFRYEEKLDRGVAQENEGARGSSNVLANSLVAAVALLAYAATGADLHADLAVVGSVPELTTDVLYLFVFAGAVATALGDTLSSEIGGVFDGPRLITTFERVEPGTDGAITWQGKLAGIVGASIVAAIALALFDAVGPLGAVVVVAAGLVGMVVDSLLGATVEGGVLGNQGVNFLATLAGGVAAYALAVPLVL